MRAIEHDLLRCPDCGDGIDGELRCRRCRRVFEVRSGVLNILPRALATAKRNEDTVFVDHGEELRETEGRPWRRVIGRQELIRFDREIVDCLRPGRFLELGGEACWASAVFKSLHPDSIVYASDVSPNALRNAAIPTAGLFPASADYFVALDAENIPFADATFDSVFAATMMHHLPQPARMLNEVVRVLKPGGIFIAIDHCVPRHFRWLFARGAETRARQYGIQEALISHPRWVKILAGTPMPRRSLQIYTNPNYQYNPLFTLAGHVVSRLPARLARQLAPVGVMIVFEKPRGRHGGPKAGQTAGHQFAVAGVPAGMRTRDRSSESASCAFARQNGGCVKQQRRAELTARSEAP